MMVSSKSGGRAVIGVLGIMALAGCCLFSTACSSHSTVEARTTTVGQELKDLEDARNKGLLTEDEYQKKRSEIMKGK